MEPSRTSRESLAPVLARGLTRHLFQRGLLALPEVGLPNGRRADLMAFSRTGELWIVEIKSSIEDFRSDQKWREYRPYCDRFFFASHEGVPMGIFPEEAGLFLADGFDAEMIRECTTPGAIHASTRKSLILQLGGSQGRDGSGQAIPMPCGPIAERYFGARLARMRCKVRRCMLRRRAVSETLRPHIS